MTFDRQIMNDRSKVWGVATVLIQSVVLLCALFLLLTIPHLLDDTFATRLEGRALPPITRFFHTTVPTDATAVMCIAILARVLCMHARE